MHVELQGFDQFGRRLERYPQVLDQEMRRAMNASLTLLEADQRRHVPMDTRALMGSITSTIEGTGAVLTGRAGPTRRYGLFVEKGTRPHWAPISALAGWARRHGVSPFAVQRAIRRRGTRAQPFIGPSLPRQRPAIERIFGRIGVRVTGFLAGG